MQDKRKSPRQESMSACLVERLFSHEPPVASKIVNCSTNGLKVELGCLVRPGEAIAVHFDPDSLERRMYGSENRIGMVRWCALRDDAGGMFNAGIELALRNSVDHR